MHVVATQIGSNVSITLVQQGEGWRFVSWCTRDALFENPLPAPPIADAARFFATSDEALDHFRGICPTL